MKISSDRMDPVSAYFAENCRNWTTALNTSNATVLFCPLSKNADVTKLCKSVLSESELVNVTGFITSELASAFIQRRAFRRYCASVMLKTPNKLAEIQFEETVKGRPYLAGNLESCFSFSSCEQGFAGAWSKTHAVGIDIEDMTRELDYRDLAKQFFTPAESRLVEVQPDEKSRKEVFFRFWCLKEAALKAIGEGLPFGMEKFKFEVNPTPRMVAATTERVNVKNTNCSAIVEQQIAAAIVSHG